MPKTTYKCCNSNCKEVFSRYGNQSTKYCSSQCYQEQRSKQEFTKICPACDKTFNGTISQVYCKQKCKRKQSYDNEKSQFIVVCPDCGTERVVFSLKYKKSKMGRCKKCAGLQSRRTNPAKTGRNSSSWKGGRRIDSYGYIKLHKPSHPFADSTNYVREHLFIACEAYGEDFIRNNGGVIHHINGNKQDNRLENLHICTSRQNNQYTSFLLQIAYNLVQLGIIEFRNGEYCCPLLGDKIGESSQTR